MWLQRTRLWFCLQHSECLLVKMIEMIQLVRWLNSFRSSALTFLSSAVWQFRGLAQLWPTPAAFCWLCFTLIDDVGSRWVWLLQSDSRATWYGTDVRCVVTQFIWVFSGPQNTCNWAQSAKTSRRGPDVPAVWCVCRCVSVLATCCLFLVTAFFVYLRLFLLPLVFLHVVL